MPWCIIAILIWADIVQLILTVRRNQYLYLSLPPNIHFFSGHSSLPKILHTPSFALLTAVTSSRIAFTEQWFLTLWIVYAARTFTFSATYRISIKLRNQFIYNPMHRVIFMGAEDQSSSCLLLSLYTPRINSYITRCIGLCLLPDASGYVYTCCAQFFFHFLTSLIVVSPPGNGNQLIYRFIKEMRHEKQHKYS